MRYRSDRSDRGFTLLELIIVMLVAGIALSMAGVAVSRSFEKGVIRREAARVQGVLRYARERSLMERAPIGFVVDEEAGQYRLEKDGAPYSPPRAVDEKLTISGGPVVFLPKGQSSGGTVVLKDDRGRTYVIETDRVTGASRVGRL